jgi:alanine dehydrogenase
MIVGVPKEIKADEHRVSITPAGVEILRQQGHAVLVERGAGKASGFEEAAYAQAGAEVVGTAKEIFQRSAMILRVKEPQPFEYALLQENQIYFAFLHLATSEEVTRAFMKAGSVAIGYETVQRADGSLPLLTPMGEVAGPMAIQEGAKYLEMAQGGHGLLLGGVPGVDPGTVLILGGGAVGVHAAKTACGLGAHVYILDTNLDRLRYLSDIMPSNCLVLMCSPAAIREFIKQADVVVGAVLVPGGRTPILVKREMLKTMKRGAVLVDVAIDQGGCFETSKETTHTKPTYVVDGIVHYCVSNMPGALPLTSTIALTNATLPYALELADKGWQKALRENADIKRGANVVKGKVTHQGVAGALALEYTPIEEVL